MALNTKAQKGTLLYAILRPWVRAGASVFFRKIILVHKERFPKDGPVILVANHQNAMLDPVIACLVFRRQLHWLTRSDVFKSPPVRRILYRLNMLPVYRERDKVANMSGLNRQTFDTCYERLQAGAVICLFPEGTHRGKKQLHLPIKKGVARLALGALSAGVGEQLIILPVGLDYSDYFNYHPRLTIEVGEPVKVSDVLKDCEGDENLATARIIEKVHQGLSASMIDIHDEESYEAWTDSEELCDEASGARTRAGRFRFYKECTRMDSASDPALIADLNDYVRLKKRMRIDGFAFQLAKKWNQRVVPESLILLATLPLMIIAATVFGIPGLFIAWFTRKVVRDQLFNNSIRMALWTFIVPIWLLLISVLIAFLSSGFWALIGLLIASGAGLWSVFWIRRFKEIRAAWKIRDAAVRYPEEWNDWCNLRERIVKALRLKRHVQAD